jgi:hypothetical protein
VETFSKFCTAIWNSDNYENKEKGKALNPLDEGEDIRLQELIETLEKTRNGKAQEKTTEIQNCINIHHRN